MNIIEWRRQGSRNWSQLYLSGLTNSLSFSLGFPSLQSPRISPHRLLSLSLTPFCTPFTTELSARCVFECVCACACVCVYVVCVNETDKSTLATPPTPNQTWQTNEICMLSNFHILPAVAFCKTPQGKYTPRLTNSAPHTLHVARVITRDLPSAQGHKRNLHVKELIYFDKHICEFSSSQTRLILHVPPVGCWASPYRLMCLGVWHYRAVFTFIAESLNFLSRLLIKNGISRGRHTSLICDIINSLESRARFNIQETQLEIWTLQHT